MKTNLTLVLLLLSACFAQAQEKWQVVYQNDGVNLVDVEYASLRVGFAIGDNGVILKTTDAGNNWQQIGSADMGDLYLLEVVNPDTVFVASKGKVYRSVNAGKNWKLIRNNASEVYTNMEYYDAVDNEQDYSALFLAGENGFLARSIDFGDEWTVKPLFWLHRKKTLLNGYFGYSSYVDVKDTVIIYQYLGSDTIQKSIDNLRTMQRILDGIHRGGGLFSKNARGIVTVDRTFYMYKCFFYGDNGYVSFMEKFHHYAQTLITNTTNDLYDAEWHAIHPNLDSLTEDGFAARIVSVGNNGNLLLWGDRESAISRWSSIEMQQADSVPNVDYRGATKGVDKDFPHLFHFTVCGEGVILRRNFNGLETSNGVEKAINIKANLYPNPSHGESRVVVYPSKTEQQEISLIDMQGHVISTRSFQAINKRPYTHRFKEDLKPGIYFVEVKGSSSRRVFKMVRI